MWNSISLKARPRLVVFNGRALRADRYICGILLGHVAYFASYITHNFSRLHVGPFVIKFLAGMFSRPESDREFLGYVKWVVRSRFAFVRSTEEVVSGEGWQSCSIGLPQL